MVKLYCTATHGISLKTLYGKTKEWGPIIIAIQDENGKLFGGFSNVGLLLRHGYSGNGSWFHLY